MPRKHLHTASTCYLVAPFAPCHAGAPLYAPGWAEVSDGRGGEEGGERETQP